MRQLSANGERSGGGEERKEKDLSARDWDFTAVHFLEMSFEELYNILLATCENENNLQERQASFRLPRPLITRHTKLQSNEISIFGC